MSAIFFGPRKWLYTTFSTGIFYLKFKFGDHRVSLPIDGRIGWNYRIINKHGTFEFFHEMTPYLSANDKWAMIPCPADYNKYDLCPDGHLATRMGLSAVRLAYITLLEFQVE